MDEIAIFSPKLFYIKDNLMYRIIVLDYKFLHIFASEEKLLSGP